MQFNDAVRVRFRELRDKNTLSNYRVSRRAGAGPSELNDFLKGKISYPRLDTFYYLCKGMGIKLSDFFDDPLFEDENIDDND